MLRDILKNICVFKEFQSILIVVRKNVSKFNENIYFLKINKNK